jgi:putative colanic acid biosynthesis acetyltransferase WcaF
VNPQGATTTPPTTPSSATTTQAPPAVGGYTPDVLAERRMSTWTFRENVKRLIWMFAWAFLFRTSFHSFYGWRRFLLRCFGAKIGQRVNVRPSAWIEIPWNLQLGDDVQVGDGAILYSLGQIIVGRLTTISQYAHLCAGTHDHTLRTFPLVRKPITVGQEAWVAAEAFVGPGVTIGDRAVAGARAVVVKDVAAEQIVAGNPARVIGTRVMRG